MENCSRDIRPIAIYKAVFPQFLAFSDHGARIPYPYGLTVFARVNPRASHASHARLTAPTLDRREINPEHRTHPLNPMETPSRIID